MAIPSDAMYHLGDAVLAAWGDEAAIGEVVGTYVVAGDLFYDISLEQTVLKALPHSALTPAQASDVQSLLFALIHGTRPPSSPRDVLLRQRYVEFLSKAFEGMELLARTEGPGVSARFHMSQQVAVYTDGSWMLAVVQGIVRLSDSVWYDVCALGEVLRKKEEELRPLAEVEVACEFELGERVRFVAADYEDDDAYVGTVCMLEQNGDVWEYAIQFDDEDVLEGIGATDLQRA